MYRNAIREEKSQFLAIPIGIARKKLIVTKRDLLQCDKKRFALWEKLEKL